MGLLISTVFAIEAAAASYFSELRPEQTLEVTFTSQGCFHFQSHEFRFRRAGGLTVEVNQVHRDWDESTRTRLPDKRIPLGTVNLTADEALALDRLIEFYRAKSEGGCTTVDQIDLTLSENGMVKSKESFEDASCETRMLVGVMIFHDVIDKCSSTPKPPREPMPDPRIEREKAEKVALTVARSLPGHDRLESGFAVKSAYVGHVNVMPESLFVELQSARESLVDAARWWNPLSNGSPSLTWDHFLNAHAIAQEVAARQPLLTAWKKLGEGRSLEVQLLGTGIGKTESDLGMFVLPAWRHAGLAGQPSQAFLARWGRSNYFELIASGQDNRMLIVSAHTAESLEELLGARSNEETPAAKPAKAKESARSPLESVNVSWHPRGNPGTPSTRYALVHPDGRIEVREFVLATD